MTSQARPAAICSCVVHCALNLLLYRVESCRLVAGMHSTSFVLGEWGVFDPSSVCLFQTSAFGVSVVFIVGCIRSQQQTPYRRLHCQSYASSIVVTRRPPKLQVRSRRPGRSQNKRKRIFSRVTQWRWRSCEPPNDNRSHKPCGLRTLPVLCFVDRRDSEAAEAAAKIAKSSGDSAAVPRTKGKEFFSRVSQWRWRSCEPQNDNRSHKPFGLRRSACR